MQMRLHRDYNGPKVATVAFLSAQSARSDGGQASPDPETEAGEGT